MVAFSYRIWPPIMAWDWVMSEIAEVRTARSALREVGTCVGGCGIEWLQHEAIAAWGSYAHGYSALHSTVKQSRSLSLLKSHPN